MPIFTYKCQDCGELFDLLILTTQEEPSCRKCNSKNLKKQIAAFGVPGASQSKNNTDCGPKRT